MDETDDELMVRVIEEMQIRQDEYITQGSAPFPSSFYTQLMKKRVQYSNKSDYERIMDMCAAGEYSKTISSMTKHYQKKNIWQKVRSFFSRIFHSRSD